MDIVPVLDIQGGLVVRARGGRRREYAPIQSAICRSPAPVDVARALVETFGFRQCYVADLDAIEGGEPAWGEYEQIAGAGLAIHIDAGVHTVAGLSRLIQFSRESQCRFHPIIGLETLRDRTLLDEFAHIEGAIDCTFSLDLRDGQPLCACPELREAPAVEIIDTAVEAGFHRIIVLDVARVGGAAGVGTLDLCREILRRHPRLSVWAGGGIASASHIEELAAAGCDGALVASALHDGRLTAPEIEALGNRPADLAGNTYNLPCKSR